MTRPNSFNIIQQSWTQLCCAMLNKVGKRIHYSWSHLRTYKKLNHITEHHCTGWHTWEQKKSRQNCETSLSWKAKLVFKIQQRWSVLNRTLNPPVNRFVVFFTVGSFKKRLHALQCQSSRVVFRWCLLSIESGKPKTHKKVIQVKPVVGCIFCHRTKLLTILQIIKFIPWEPVRVLISY